MVYEGEVEGKTKSILKPWFYRRVANVLTWTSKNVNVMENTDMAA